MQARGGAVEPHARSLPLTTPNSLTPVLFRHDSFSATSSPRTRHRFTWFSQTSSKTWASSSRVSCARWFLLPRQRVSQRPSSRRLRPTTSRRWTIRPRCRRGRRARGSGAALGEAAARGHPPARRRQRSRAGFRRCGAGRTTTFLRRQRLPARRRRNRRVRSSPGGGDRLDCCILKSKNGSSDSVAATAAVARRSLFLAVLLRRKAAAPLATTAAARQLL